MKRFCNVCKIELIKGETWGKYTNFLCKPHNREYVLKYYYKQREKYILLTRERDKKNINNPKRRAQRAANSVKMYKKYHERMLSIARLHHAVKTGKVIKLACHCGNFLTQGHHHKGYEGANALDILWLCQKHHLMAHNKYFDIGPKEVEK